MSQHPTPEQLEAALKVIDTQAGMLIAAADRANALQRENADERQARLKYQGLVYLVCAELDHALGRHVSNGTGTLADEESVMKAIRLLAAKLSAAEAALRPYVNDENVPLRQFAAKVLAAIDAAKKREEMSHAYVTHHTYTGKGCAICGKSEKEHAAKSDVKEHGHVNLLDLPAKAVSESEAARGYKP